MVTFQCLSQKTELEKKLASFTVNEGTGKESNILIKHLQEELRNYVGFSSSSLILNLNVYNKFFLFIVTDKFGMLIFWGICL